MTFHHQEQVKKPKSWRRWLWILPVIGIVGGGYLLINSLAPVWEPLLTPSDTVAKKLVETPKASPEDRLYIPKINVDVKIVQGTDAASLEEGAWWRKPQNGNPKGGGNFVLSAHRFNLGLTPQKTRAKSPFFHLDKLEPGDEVVVDYDAERFVYKVNRRYSVDRDAVEIEERTHEPKLTLYSCDLRGELAGREVVEAIPVKSAMPVLEL